MEAEMILTDDQCPNCGDELTLVEIRPDTFDEYGLEAGVNILNFVCPSCAWHGHVSEGSSEILFEEIYEG